ncbi:MAG: SAM-dependent chlorinase/fluorinase, partial [Bryobacteraceae bacterium]|nr:SAM-dependent chlorinase/fluorinase [Bryobacteraceae bacterium]
MRKPLITLTTDFGSADHFVGTMKGVILRLCPQAAIVDISHEITPFEIAEAGFVIAQAYPYFPKKTVHVVVVDPGVGTLRRPILAEAAGIHEGKFVAQTQSYGPEARGGASKSEVVISDAEIDYPKAIKPDVLLCMSQAACDTYIFDLKPEGVLMVDATWVHDLPTTRAISIPFTKLAREKAGSEMYA